LIEAMSCGVPVIGSSSGEIPHVIGDGGLVFAEGDSQALANHVHYLSTTQDAYAALSQQARQRILTTYTQGAVAHQYWQIYRQMLGYTS
jgi:glycosyltransferase involved in cell wall biosynthesis